MAGALEIVTKFTSDTSGLEAGATKAKSAIGGIGPEALLMGAGVVAGIGVAVAAISGMVTAAAEDEAGQKKLESAITAAGAATATSTDQVNAAIAAGQAKAFTDDQTREALQSLVTATGDVTEATKLLGPAQDIARFAGVDLATAADAVAKAHAGNDGALRKLIPGLEKGATAQDTLTAAQKAAAGQADEYAQTTEGSLAIASDSFSELGETIGSAFLPLLKAIIPPLTKLIAALGVLIEAIIPPLSILFEALGVVLGVVIDILTKYIEISLAIWKVIFAQLTPALKALSPVVDAVGRAFSGLVDFIKTVIGWVQQLLAFVQSLLDKLAEAARLIGSLPGVSLITGQNAAPSTAGASTRSGTGGVSATGGTVVVNVYGGDPRKITEAVKSGYRRWIETEGRTAPTRPW